MELSSCLICDSPCPCSGSGWMKMEEVERDSELIISDTVTVCISKPATDSFYKLLQLSSPSSTLTPTPGGEGQEQDIEDIAFCVECFDIMNQVTQVFEQIQNLQEQLDGHKLRIKGQLIQSHSKHVADQEKTVGVGVGITGTRSRKRQVNHECTMFCSAVHKLRHEIVEELRLGSASVEDKSTDTEPQLPASKTRKKSVTVAKVAARKKPEPKPKKVQLETSKVQSEAHSEVIDKPKAESDDDYVPDIPDSFVPDSDGEGYVDDQDDEAVTDTGNLNSSVSVEKPSRGTRLTKTKKRKSRVKGAVRKPKKVKGVKLQFQCTECPEIFPSEHRRRAHLTKTHEVPLFPHFCTRCGKRYHSETALENHLKRQGGECKKNELPAHGSILTGHGDKKFICNICQLPCTSRNRLQIHSVVHDKTKRGICDICGESFNQKQYLNIHKLLKHSDGPNHPLKCKDCGKVFGLPTHLRIHEKMHRKELDYPCPDCDYKTVSQGRLNYHMKFVHTEEKRYKCTQCDCAYRRGDKLKRHILTQHTSEADRPHRCMYCDKSFAQRYNMTRHEITHTNEKPKVCPICGKGFAVREYLRSHLKTHNKGKDGGPKPKDKEKMAAGQQLEQIEVCEIEQVLQE